MDAGTLQNAALVEQASAAAQALMEQARNLSRLISRYQVGGAAPPSGAIQRDSERAVGLRKEVRTHAIL
jgi:methyl-accepting chemotaxis protein